MTFDVKKVVRASVGIWLGRSTTIAESRHIQLEILQLAILQFSIVFTI